MGSTTGTSFPEPFLSSSGRWPRAPSINVNVPWASCISHQASVWQPFCTGHTMASWDVDQAHWIERQANLWKGQSLPEGNLCVHVTLEWLPSPPLPPNSEKLSRVLRLALLIDLVNDGYSIRYILGKLKQMYWIAPVSGTLNKRPLGGGANWSLCLLLYAVFPGGLGSPSQAWHLLHRNFWIQCTQLYFVPEITARENGNYNFLLDNTKKKTI